MATDPRHERRDRQHLQRVPPHDLAAEMAILGAAMAPGREVPPLVASLATRDFYGPSNQLIADAVTRLVAEGAPVDTGTVSAMLREDGQLEGINGTTRTGSKHGEAYLTSLVVESFYSDAVRAQRDADLIVELARKRQILGLASLLVEGVYARTEISGVASQLQATIEEAAAGQTSSWEPVNLTAILAGEGETIVPSMLHRADGQALLYPRKIHAFIGEPEACKGWLALWACLEVIERGGHALYVDFEDDAATAVERLLNMGADPGHLLERFHYVQPDEPIDIGATARVKAILSSWPIAVCVIDSVGEGMALSGLDEKDSTDFRGFKAAVAEVARRAGAAVILIDHVVKDPEKRGGYAIGGQAKKAAIDVVYELQVIEPFGRDRQGRAKVWCRKDRLGHVRGASLDGKLTAELSMDSRDGGTSVSITLGTPGSTPARHFRPTGLMAKISAALERATDPMSKTVIRSVIGGKHSYTDIALGLLLAEGYIAHSSKGYTHLRPFTTTPEAEPEQGELVPTEGIADDF